MENQEQTIYAKKEVLSRSEMKKIMGGAGRIPTCCSKRCYWVSTPNGGYWLVCDCTCACPEPIGHPCTPS